MAPVAIDVYQNVGQISPTSIEIPIKNTNTSPNLSPINVIVKEAETTENNQKIQNKSTVKNSISKSDTPKTSSLKIINIHLMIIIFKKKMLKLTKISTIVAILFQK
ncbi:MAG: hypothetical protein L6V95_15410 [Candidatus Melainabacteria bacterium]|nr:MAG: hypothetical protein L6V95_15410 [Candidatus Melainabacteria bacterium]